MARRHHPLIQSLLKLEGNARACIYLEPLWGIGYNLYIPFSTLYMDYLGLIDARIDLMLTVGTVVQVFAALLGSPVVDKIGRRQATFLCGLVGWSMPVLILIFARNFLWFLLATFFSGIYLVESAAWNCLLVEDAQKEQIVDLYNWATISGLLAVFFAPLAGLLIKTLPFIRAFRYILAFSFVLITAKIVSLYFWSRETGHGQKRLAETKHVPYRRLLTGQREVFLKLVRNKAAVQTMIVLVLIQISNLVSVNFFALFATQKAAIPEWLIAYFPMARSAIMLVFIFGLQQFLARFSLQQVLKAGLATYFLTTVLLLLAPLLGSTLLLGYTLLDALAYALVWPRRSTLLALNMDGQERARGYGLVNALMITAASPFGWLAGWLSDINRSLPFALNGLLYLACLVFLARSRDMHDLKSTATGKTA